MRYVDRTEPLSQSGALRAYHEDLLRRPPGYDPEHPASWTDSVKDCCGTLYWRWQRIKSTVWPRHQAGTWPRGNASNETLASVADNQWHDPWA